MNLTVKIPAKGTAKGTCGYIKKILSNVELEIKNTPSGDLAMVGTFPNGTEIVICRTPDSAEADECMHGYESGGIYLVHLYPINTDWRHGLFGRNLTPAAERYVDEFIDKCSDKLAKFINEDS